MSPEPCVICGADSVGACLSCKRRMCNRHMVLSAKPAGWDFRNPIVGAGQEQLILGHPVGESREIVAKGPFLDAFVGGQPRCSECRASDGNQAVRRGKEDEERQAQETRELSDLLKRSAAPLETAKLLAKGAYDLAKSDPELVVEAWTRVAASDVIPHSRELVTAMIQLNWRGKLRGDWVVRARHPLWTVRNFNGVVGWLTAEGEKLHPNPHVREAKARVQDARESARHELELTAMLEVGAEFRIEWGAVAEGRAMTRSDSGRTTFVEECAECVYWICRGAFGEPLIR